MLDPISIVGASFSVISYAISSLDLLWTIIHSLCSFSAKSQAPSLRLTKPHIPTFARLIVPQLQPHLDSLNEVITAGSDEVFERFRTSYSFDCNMVAVAGAIIAQIAMTSLTLPYLSKTHWVSRALFIVSVISGSLSVYFCVMTQKIIGTQYTPHEIRHWLTAPLPQSILPELYYFEHKLADVAEKAGDGNVNAEIAPHIESGDFERLKANLTTKTPSILSVLVLSVPAFMLNISLSALLIALGIYLGFIWTRNLDTDAGLHDSRNVFIFYIVGVFSMIAVYFIPNALKNSEDRHQAVRKRILNLLEQVERKVGRPTPGSSERLIVQDSNKEDEVKEFQESRVLSNKALGDMAEALKENVQVQEALLKANLALLAEIRGTSSDSKNS